MTKYLIKPAHDEMFIYEPTPYNEIEMVGCLHCKEDWNWESEITWARLSDLRVIWWHRLDCIKTK